MAVAHNNEAEILRIVGAAEQARLAGRREEARRLLSQAQAIAPDHPRVLGEAGLSHLQAGDAQAARQCLEDALKQDDRTPALWLNLATVLRKLDLSSEEAKALERVLALDPRHLFGLLQKASLLERIGKPRAAAKMYVNALLTIPRGAKLPESLRPAIEHAQDAVRRNTASLSAFLDDRLRELRDQHASEPQERFEHCLATYLGRSRIYVPEPNFLYYPKLPALEFHAREDFPWLDRIEAGTAEIRSEFERVFTEDTGRLEPYIAYPEGVPLDQWAELNHSRRWSVFYLWRDGQPLKEHLERCPRTAALLSEAPVADVPGHAPSAFFSILDAKSHIPPHTGVTNTRLIVHLPLVIPGRCRFRVGSQTREWQAGKAWVFDDTIEHEAWNDSDLPRAVLIFDVWNNYLNSTERELVRTAVGGIGDYYHGE
ncbi:MAG TPA: aspartyl/asparaginyl beta-hydroxylase domain-containing protein [Steroidobacteraceae bacterium]|nr:aspartyl/asparaginyl beta-hydroxylase domain-containing protein [Steroidobacteraceae bacterium]